MLDTSKYGYMASLKGLAAISNPKPKGNTMKLRKIGNNVTELTLSDGTQLLISYETPVAAYSNGMYSVTSRALQRRSTLRAGLVILNRTKF